MRQASRRSHCIQASVDRCEDLIVVLKKVCIYTCVCVCVFSAVNQTVGLSSLADNPTFVSFSAAKHCGYKNNKATLLSPSLFLCSVDETFLLGFESLWNADQATHTYIHMYICVTSARTHAPLSTSRLDSPIHSAGCLASQCADRPRTITTSCLLLSPR